jgi:hypothetical protein
LLERGEPELALVAAWALQDKYGPLSKALALRAAERTAALPEPVRGQQGRAIMHLLSAPLRQHLHAMLLKDLDKVPQGKSFKKFMRALEAPAEARGKADALLKYCAQRGVELTPEQRERIAHCTDSTRLDHWLERAFAAQTPAEIIAAVFG